MEKAKKTKKVSEQNIQKEIFDYLKSKNFIVFKHRNVGIFVQKTGKYIPLPTGEHGISDVIGCRGVDEAKKAEGEDARRRRHSVEASVDILSHQRFQVYVEGRYQERLPEGEKASQAHSGGVENG